MIRYSVVVTLATLLVGCPGGQEIAVQSGYSLTKPVGDYKSIHKGYPDALLHPPLELGQELLIQLSTSNVAIISPREGHSTGPLEVDFWVSGRRDGLKIDTSSFHLVVDETDEMFLPTVLFTSARAQVPMKGGVLRLVCDFRDYIGGVSAVTESIAVPEWGDRAWPPIDYDESMLCLRLVFPESAERFPPQAHYTLRFTYLNKDGTTEVAVHLFPVTFTYFSR